MKQRIVIEAVKPWKPFDFAEIFRYRDMLYFKIINAYKADHRQTILSYFWAVIDPFTKIIFFYLIFGKIAHVATGHIPYLAFNASGIVLWNFIGICLNTSISSLTNESMLLQKIYFPRLFIPLVPCISQVPNFLLNLVITLGLLAFLGFTPTWRLLGIFPIFLFSIVIAYSVGLLLSSYALQYRDIRRLWGGIMQFMVYTVPVAYPLSAVPPLWRNVYLLNPMAAAVEGFRCSLLGQPVPWMWLGIDAVVVFIIFYFSAGIFRMREPLIIDAA